MTMELCYFPHKGLAEGFRIAMYAKNIKYKDCRFTCDQWKVAKGSQKKLTVPYMETDCGRITQSCALYSYVGDMTGLLPKDMTKRARSFEMFGCMLEMMHMFRHAMTLYDREKMQYCKKMNDEELPAWLEHMDSLICANNGGNCEEILWCCGSDFCLMDYVMYGYIGGMIFSGMVDGIDKDMCNNYKCLSAVLRHVDSMDVVQKWNKEHNQYALY